MDEKTMHQEFNRWWSSNRMRLGGYLLKDQAWIGWKAGWQQQSQLTNHSSGLANPVDNYDDIAQQKSSSAITKWDNPPAA
jgi:hypothetical protein